MSFLKEATSTKKSIPAKLTLVYLSQKEVYKKDVCYFRVENIEALDVLEEFYETHSLPVFKSVDGDVLLRVNLKYIEEGTSEVGLEKNKQYIAKCRFSLWELDKKCGFTCYINDLEEL